MKRRAKLAWLSLSSMAGLGLVVGGTLALFNAQASNQGNQLAAGKVAIQVWHGAGCVNGDGSSTDIPLSTLQPGDKKSDKFTVQNTGTLDEWVGVESVLPANFPMTVNYTVYIYAQDPAGSEDDGTDKDSNGDLHSNCHTGHFFHGAGGDDKNAVPQPLSTIPQQTISSTEEHPARGFQLTPGEYAVIAFTYGLPSNASAHYENKSDVLTIKFEAVQVRNNDGPDGPMTWDASGEESP